jgi:putative ABC transport system substrate-binding protein
MQGFADQAGISLDLAVLPGKIDKDAYVRVFEVMAGEQVDGLIVNDGAENITYRQVIAELAASHRLAAIYAYREAAESGGLMSYGIDLADVLKRLGEMTDQVLRGTKIGEIPFYQQTRFELVLNRRVATALGLEFPPGLLVSADEVIE